MRVFHGLTDDDRAFVQDLARQLSDLADAPGIHPWNPVRLWNWAMALPVQDRRARLIASALMHGAPAST